MEIKWLVRASLILVIAVLLYFALHNTPVQQIWDIIQQLRLWQIGLLLSIDVLIYLLITARWWFIVRSEHRAVQYFPLVGIRMAVFAISYFTVGPQLGGEPLQVLYLKRNIGLTYTRATASVVMDKLIELLSNFVLALIGSVAIIHSGILFPTTYNSLTTLAILVAVGSWPLVHILLLRNRLYPISEAFQIFAARQSRTKLLRFVRAAEHLAGQFCQRHPRAMIAALALSFVTGFTTIGEYALLISFLRISLPFWHIVTGWAAGWFSFLVPLPGGLGAFEASQVLVLGLLGVPAASAIGVVLLIRARDLLIGVIGLLMAGYTARKI